MTRVNPYASPRSDEPATPEILPPAQPFGLAAPIHAAGDYTRGDIRAAIRLAFGPLRPVLVIALCFSAVVVWFMLHGLAEMLIGATLLALVLVVLFTAWYGRVVIAGRARRELCEPSPRHEFDFAEDEITVRSSTTLGTRRWGACSKCTCGPAHVLLHMFPPSEWTVVPRSFFAHPDQWDLFVRVVRHKLPQKSLLSPPPTDAAPATAGPPDATDRRAIRGRGRATLAEAQRGLRHLPGYWSWRLLPIPYVAILIAPLALVCAAVGPPPPYAWLPTILGLTVIVWMLILVPRRQLITMSRSGQGAFAAFAVAAWEEQLDMDSAQARNTIRWEHYGSFRQIPGMLLLYFRTGTRAQLLPRSLFDDAAWAALMALVERKLPRR